MELKPIAEINPQLAGDTEFRGIVTLIWPYSSATRQYAALLAEPDFRLRRRKGQVRVRFSEASGKAVAETRPQIGDEVTLRLKGARFVGGEEVERVSTPGRSLDWELEYAGTVFVKLARQGEEVARLELVNEPCPPTPTSVTRRPPSILTSAAAPILPPSDQTYASPAFKRIRLSDGPLSQPAFDPLIQDGREIQARKRPRKSWGDWKTFTYSRRAPSPEKEGMTDDEILSSPLRPSHLPDTPISPTEGPVTSNAALPPLDRGLHTSLEDERARQSYTTIADSDLVALDDKEPSIDVAQQSKQEDFVRDADYYDLYAGPDEQPPPGLANAYGGDTESNTSVEDLADEVHETPDVEEIVSIGDEGVGEDTTGEAELRYQTHRAQSEGGYLDLEPPSPDVSSFPHNPPRIVMPPPTLPSLQTEFPAQPSSGLLTPIGKEPSSPVIKPLDSSTLPMPSPFPGERDANLTSYLDHVSLSQPQLEQRVDEYTNEDGYIEVNFHDSVSSANAPAFHPTHESAFTDVRFTFGMDGSTAMDEEHASLSTEDRAARTEKFSSRQLDADMLFHEELSLQALDSAQGVSDPFDNPFLKDQHEDDQMYFPPPALVSGREQQELPHQETEEQINPDEVPRPWTSDPFDNPFLQDPISVQVKSPLLSSTALTEPEVITLSSDVESVHGDSEEQASHLDNSMVDRDEQFKDLIVEDYTDLHMDTEAAAWPSAGGKTNEASRLPGEDSAEAASTIAEPRHDKNEAVAKVSEVIDLGSSSEPESDAEVPPHEELEAHEPGNANSMEFSHGEVTYTDDQPHDGFQEHKDHSTYGLDEQDTPIEAEDHNLRDGRTQLKDVHSPAEDAHIRFMYDGANEDSAMELDHPDIKVESIEDHPPLHSVAPNEPFPEEGNTQGVMGPSAVLEIEVPDDGHKIGEMHTIKVATTGPARNTRSKTKASTMSPSVEDSPVPEPKKSSRKSRGSVVSELGRATLSPPHTRSGHVFEPTQDEKSQSPYSLRSRSKQVSPGPPSPTSSARKSRVQHDVPLSSPLKHSFASQDVELPDIGSALSQDLGASQASQGRFSNIASVKDSFEDDDLHSDQSISTAPYSEEHFLRSKHKHVMDDALHSEDYQGALQSDRVIDETPAVISLAESESQPQASLSPAPEELPGEVTPKGTQVTTDVAYPDVSDISHLQSSRLVEEQPASRSSTSKYDLRRRQGSAVPADSTSASVNQQSLANSNLPITPDASQQTFTESQTTLEPGQFEQSMPITPQLTQRTSTSLRSFQKDSQGDVEMEETNHETLIKSVSLTKLSPRQTRSTKDVASAKLPTNVLSDTEKDHPTLPEPPSRGISTLHGYYSPLVDLIFFLNRSSQHYTQNNPDILALVTSATTTPKKADKGPKHWNTTLKITDPSLWSSLTPGTPRETVVQIFRPYASALPEAKEGDVVLLRCFTVKSLNRQPMLISGEDSAWCAWRWHKRVWGAKRGPYGELKAREECKGPPVELGDDERGMVERFRGWWESTVKDSLEEKEAEAAGGKEQVEVEPRRSGRVVASQSQKEKGIPDDGSVDEVSASQGTKVQKHKRNKSSLSEQVDVRVGAETRSKGKLKVKESDSTNGYHGDRES